MLKLNHLEEGKIYKAKGNETRLFAVVQGRLVSDFGKFKGDAVKAAAALKEFSRDSSIEGSYESCQWIPGNPEFNLLQTAFDGEGIKQGIAMMKEGQVYQVKILTGKQITVEETKTAQVVTLGGTTFRISNDLKNPGKKVIKELKSKISTKTEPKPLA